MWAGYNSLKPDFVMRYIVLLICSSFLFTSCFTTSTLDKAKEDRMPERVKEVLTSYKDTIGNAVIVYKKRYRRPVYKTVVPLDAILSKYKAVGKNDLRNEDSTIANFNGVYTVTDAKNKKGEQLIILLNKETKLTDTAGLYKEIARNEHLVEKHKGKTSIPTEEFSMTREEIKTKAASFTVRTEGDKKYLIVFQPHRRKPFRYLLAPFAAGLDAVTLPVQIVIGLVLLSKVPLS
jgi:hypothetical protein